MSMDRSSRFYKVYYVLTKVIREQLSTIEAKIQTSNKKFKAYDSKPFGCLMHVQWVINEVKIFCATPCKVMKALL